MRNASGFDPIRKIAKLAGIIAGLTGLAALASACGPLNNEGNAYAVQSYSVGSISGITSPGGNTSLSGSSSGSFNCPALDVNNVVPNYNFNDNGTGDFQVCTNLTSADEILVKGIGGTSTGDQICVFPAETSGGGTDYQQTNWIPGAAGLPLYECGTASLQQGVALTFPSTATFNAAFIVDASVANQMYQCLQTDNSANCPQQYSYGEFR